MADIFLIIITDIIGCLPLFACMIFIFAMLGIILGYGK